MNTLEKNELLRLLAENNRTAKCQVIILEHLRVCVVSIWIIACFILLLK